MPASLAPFSSCRPPPVTWCARFSTSTPPSRIKSASLAGPARGEEKHPEGGEVDHEIRVGTVEDGTREPRTRRRAQAIADTEEAEDRPIVSQPGDPAQEHGDVGGSRAEGQEEQQHVAVGEDPGRPGLHGEETQHAGGGDAERDESRRGRSDAPGQYMPAAKDALSSPIQEDGMPDSTHVMLTVLLHHDQSKTLDEIMAHLKKIGFYGDVPPEGSE